MPSIREQLKKLTNFSFGGTSAIITNMSIIIGLGSVDIPKSAIVTSLLVIAIADNISDSLGIHIYRESESCGIRESFVSTASNFLTRLFISLVFILIIILLPILTAQLVSIIWGLLTLTVISYLIAKKNQQKPAVELIKHIGVAVLVIAASKYVGTLIHSHFGK